MIGHVVTGVVLVAAVHFVFLALGGGLFGSPLIALMAFAFWRLVQPEERGARGYQMVALMTGIGTVVASAVAVVAGVMPATSLQWLGVVVSTGLAAAIYSLTVSRGATPCPLCENSMTNGLSCPRCQDTVCTRPTCWNAKHARCARCLDRAVVALPMHQQWWKTRFGRKAGRGQCAYCFKQADEANLYECPTCAQALCDRCWDHQNGVCSRCQWVIPNLPEKLTAVLPLANAGLSKSSGRGGSTRPRPRAPAERAPDIRPRPPVARRHH